jgi:GTP pyrophosphokinase
MSTGQAHGASRLTDEPGAVLMDGWVAPIVRVAAGEGLDAADAQTEEPVRRARAFAEPLLAGQALDNGENALDHADGIAAILQRIGAAPPMRAAAYLVYAGEFLQKPEDTVARAFGPSQASLVVHTRKLMALQRTARDATMDTEQRAQQSERVRKMLLAFSRDLRVVLLRLASRLQTLRYCVLHKETPDASVAQEALHVFAPLANRLGIWQLKWELEDLSFRFLNADEYKRIARLLDERRVEREARLEAFRQHIVQSLRAQGIEPQVSGRPKHIYSIWKKMQGKNLDFSQVYDLRALRVIVPTVADCYATLSWLHSSYQTVAEEFDDYIAKPKPNGYSSLHTVVFDEHTRPVEVQIRTQAMHDHAENGVAAHWAYKEAGVKGYVGVEADEDDNARMASARRAVLNQLLEWERDQTEAASADDGRAAEGEGASFYARIYVFTPQASLIELPLGATPIDFAYVLHTELGHRCRGARVDGAMVPLNASLSSGQTVEILTAKEGGPSLDWLNADLGYLKSPRAKAKVRAWFNVLAQRQTVARGREAVEKLLQREGKTAVRLDDLASQLGFDRADDLFEVVGKDEFSLRTIENLLRPAEAQTPEPDVVPFKRIRTESASRAGGVLVVGVDSLLTSLARCCRPAPPDAIGGYVTRGKGVAIHRAECCNFKEMARRNADRVIAVAWSPQRADAPTAAYPVDVAVEAADRQGLLRDISDVFAKEKVNVVGVNTQSVRDTRGGTARMTFTLEVPSAARLRQVLNLITHIAGVRSARRR